MNINININNKTFNKINLTSNNSNQNITKQRFKLKKCVIDRKNKINLNIYGSKLVNTKNKNSKNTPTFIKIKRNNTQNKLQRGNQKLPLIVNITDNNKTKENSKSINRVNRTYNFNCFKNNDKSKYNGKISFNRVKTKEYSKKNLKQKKISHSFCLQKVNIKK